jgi:hypothetical protein
MFLNGCISIRFPDEIVGFSNCVVCCGFTVRLPDREKIFFCFPDCPDQLVQLTDNWGLFSREVKQSHEVAGLRMSRAIPSTNPYVFMECTW